MRLALPALPLLALALAGCTNDPGPATPAGGGRQAPPPTAVETVVITTHPVSQEITAVGSTQADESVIIRPELAGRVIRIDFSEGQPVKRGDLLIALDDSILQAELAQAQADLALATSDYNRAIDLFNKGSGSARTRDEAAARLASDTARVELGKARLDKTRIRAPFSGLLGLRTVSIGDYVTPGQALVNLEDIDPVKVDFRVPEVFLARLGTGQVIHVQVDAFPGETFSGEVYALDPRVDAEGRSVALRARIQNPEGKLRPGLFARVALVTRQREGVLMVPEQAIFARGADHFVYKIVDGKAQLTGVRLGERQGAEVEALDGVAAGDTIVVAGHLKLRDGAPVRPVETGST